jgi:hypothetical protein
MLACAPEEAGRGRCLEQWIPAESRQPRELPRPAEREYDTERHWRTPVYFPIFFRRGIRRRALKRPRQEVDQLLDLERLGDQAYEGSSLTAIARSSASVARSIACSSRAASRRPMPIVRDPEAQRSQALEPRALHVLATAPHTMCARAPGSPLPSNLSGHQPETCSVTRCAPRA